MFSALTKPAGFSETATLPVRFVAAPPVLFLTSSAFNLPASDRPISMTYLPSSVLPSTLTPAVPLKSTACAFFTGSANLLFEVLTTQPKFCASATLIALFGLEFARSAKPAFAKSIGESAFVS